MVNALLGGQVDAIGGLSVGSAKTIAGSGKTVVVFERRRHHAVHDARRRAAVR